MKPLVSVAVFSYNQEEYIAETLDSVLGQERDFAIEVLINDDGSTDRTPEIISEYEYKYPDIIKSFLRPVNKGLLKCYYEVLGCSQGKYIMDIAGDDYWLPGKMKYQINAMEADSGMGMCYGKAIVLKGNNFIASSGTKEGENFESLLSRNHIPPLTVCIRNTELSKYIKDVEPQNKDWMMEDLPMCLWFSKNSRICFMDRYFGVYRVLEGSVSRPKSLEKRLDFANSINDICLFFAGNDKRYKNIAKKAHERTVASMYLAFDDMRNFRKHNAKGGPKGIVKNIISFFPRGKDWLKTNITH